MAMRDEASVVARRCFEAMTVAEADR